MTLRMKTKIFSTILLILGITLSACGFHLKKESAFKGSIDELSITSQNINPAFMHALKRKLEDAGIMLSDTAAYKLNILRFEENRRAISNNNLTAKPTETQLNYRLSFSLTQDKVLLISPTQVERNKEYPNNNLNVAGMLDEERILAEAAQEELIELLMRRLANLQVDENSLGVSNPEQNKHGN